MRDQLIRMCNEAKDRLYDADILGMSLRARSDSQAFLRVLAFEVLLKAAAVASGLRHPWGHKYAELWSSLPASTRDAVLAVAIARMPGHTDFSDIERLLKWYQFVFERARYSYELYDGYSLEEQRDLGQFWEGLGAPVDEAIIQYHPNELQCLIEGLIAYIENAL